MIAGTLKWIGKVAGAYLLFGALVRSVVYILLPAQQYASEPVEHGLTFALGIALLFLINRWWVGVAQGIVLSMLGRIPAPVVVAIGSALPVALELLVNVDLPRYWLAMGPDGVRVAAGYLATPLVAGCASAWMAVLRRRPCDRASTSEEKTFADTAAVP